jgi:hypothetical protein
MMTSFPEYESFCDFSRWAPRSPRYWLLHPQKAGRRLWAESVPLAVRVRPCSEPRLAGRPSLVWWSYDRGQFGEKLHLTFESAVQIEGLDARWRVIAGAVWRLVTKDPALVFLDVPVDLGDGCSRETPEAVFCFARPRGEANALLPNPYLLQKRRRVPGPRRWESKTDTMYFRGADTGSPDVDRNTRVALCRAAALLPRTDCRLTRLDQGSPEFKAQVRREGLVGRRISLPEMNKHRFLVDADGNTTSWDRYLWTGTFGGVPILFEPAWEECWHSHLVDGDNCIVADRTTLGNVLERLRSEPALAKHIAAGAARLVATQLSPAGAQEMFETAWKARCVRVGSPSRGSLHARVPE